MTQFTGWSICKCSELQTLIYLQWVQQASSLPSSYNEGAMFWSKTWSTSQKQPVGSVLPPLMTMVTSQSSYWQCHHVLCHQRASHVRRIVKEFLEVCMYLSHWKQSTRQPEITDQADCKGYNQQHNEGCKTMNICGALNINHSLPVQQKVPF